tara:strand:- start:1770 stop:2384 length:615 start_codon:yes stop_codon:yes gene_type:complete
MNYIIYKITNNLETCDEYGMYYTGAHKTTDINDDYMGSGTLIKKAIKKYGVENFVKETLAVYGTENEMWKGEKKLVNHEDPMSYNLTEGGRGGGSAAGKLGAEKFWELFDNDERFAEKFKKKVSDNNKKRWKEGKHPFQLNPYDWTGKKHREESKRKIGEANSITQLGDKNSQYGTMWITDGFFNKKIKKEQTIPTGWRKGRVL